ncbi:DUF6783 domain-containing protein [Blautia sp. MSJ-9]
MCVTICGRFCSDEGVVAGYASIFLFSYIIRQHPIQNRWIDWF